MTRFEYTITKHPAAAFNDLVYYCSEAGECSLNQVSRDSAAVLQEILNDQGRQGFELVQLAFGRDGVVAFWKKELA